MPALDDDRLYEAIRRGVADGIFRIATNASDMPSLDFYEAIRQGVKEALLDTGVELRIGGGMGNA